MMKRALTAAFFTLGFALLVSPAQAQMGTARGKVVDADGKPVAGAKVLIEYLGGVTRKFEVKSNKKGDWMQVGMAPGQYRFTATKEGYQGTVIEHRIGIGETSELPPLMLNAGVAQASAQASAELDKLRKGFEAAVALMNDGKLDEAEAAYKVLLAEHPDVAEVHQNLGYIYAQKQDYPSAEAEYTKALELRPDSSDIMIALAGVYQRMGEPDKAKAMSDKAASANPADAGAQFTRGLFLVNSNQTEEAIAAFKAAVAADPTMTEAYFRLGTLMVQQGKIPEAIQYLEKYLGMNPTDAQNVATAQGLIKALKK